MARPGVVAVTGASRGIGAAVALELARRGLAVGCLSRSGRAPDAKEADREAAGRLVPLACDVTDEAGVREALAVLAGRPGGLVGLVNNAGIYAGGRSAALPTAELERVMRVNATAVFVACREAYPHLTAAGGGTIVNIGSFFDRLGVAGSLAYCASKAAVGAITRCLAAEWAPKGITVVDVAPGYVETDLNRGYLADERRRGALLERIPVGRTGVPDEVARLVAAIVVERIGFLTGTTIYVDGGQGAAL